MPPDLPNEQEISLKKRARRRLVGAVILVLIMLLILPKILLDRETLSPQQPIKISMTESAESQKGKPDSIPQTTGSGQVVNTIESQTSTSANTVVAPLNSGLEEKATKSNLIPTEVDRAKLLPSDQGNHDEKTTSPQVVESKPKLAEGPKSNDPSELLVGATVKSKDTVAKAKESNVPEAKLVESKSSDSKTEVKVQSKKDGNFSIQVGVYSDPANVKHLQDKLKQEGFSSHTQKVNTPKGEKIRLRVGSFSSRQEASSAVPKLQKIGLLGIVVSND